MSTTPATPPPPLRIRAIRAVVIAVLLPLLFVSAFVIPGHDPQPNGLPVAVAGSPALAQQLEAGGFDVLAAPDRAAAEQRVRDRDAYGAFFPGTGDQVEVSVASGASAAVATSLNAIAQDAGALVGTDLAPLPDGDPRGATLNLLVLPLIITAIIGALLATQLLPEIPTRGRVLLTALVGVLAGAGTIAIGHLLDALPGSFLAETGLAALMVIGVALTAGAIVRRLGPPGLIVAFLVFLVAGNPASGLASAPELLPTPWKEVGALLPPGALGDALRGTAYFDGAAVLAPVLVLLAWVAIGVGAHLLVDRRAVSR